jgi:hypothetical protein
MESYRRPWMVVCPTILIIHATAKCMER